MFGMPILENNRDRWTTIEWRYCKYQAIDIGDTTKSNWKGQQAGVDLVCACLLVWSCRIDVDVDDDDDDLLPSITEANGTQLMVRCNGHHQQQPIINNNEIGGGGGGGGSGNDKANNNQQHKRELCCWFILKNLIKSFVNLSWFSFDGWKYQIYDFFRFAIFSQESNYWIK